eukprot:766991-Hanusia_phi.AAC.8
MNFNGLARVRPGALRPIRSCQCLPRPPPPRAPRAAAGPRALLDLVQPPGEPTFGAESPRPRALRPDGRAAEPRSAPLPGP